MKPARRIEELTDRLHASRELMSRAASGLAAWPAKAWCAIPAVAIAGDGIPW